MSTSHFTPMSLRLNLQSSHAQHQPKPIANSSPRSQLFSLFQEFSRTALALPLIPTNFSCIGDRRVVVWPGSQPTNTFSPLTATPQSPSPQSLSTAKQYLAKLFKKFVPPTESIAQIFANLTTCFILSHLASPSSIYAHWAPYPHVPGHPSGCPFCEPDSGNFGQNENPDDLNGWKVCNRSTQPFVRVAHGSYNENLGSWYSEGWWWIKEGNCENIISPGIHLRTGTRYIYAEGWNALRNNRTGAFWKGEGGNGVYFCTNKNNHFTYNHGTNCIGSDLELINFTSFDMDSKFGHTTTLD